MQLQLSLFTIFFIALSAVASVIPAELESRDAWSDQVLQQHNTNRAKYGARPLTWNANLYPAALQWAKQCKFQHSSGAYGENLAAGSGNYGMSNAMSAWMGEASQYNYNNPGFSAATGHFTQVVWKSTTSVACAIADCPAGSIFSGLASKYVVCRYAPPGNYQGQFPQNVGRPT
ncbi:CAP domain-containing protein [Cyathus striatus]|nr:CAP domain-containing protein [Cyathus striatus]